MTEEQIATAKREKKLYLTVFYATVIFWIFGLPLDHIFPDNKWTKYLELGLSLGLIPFQIVFTWRFSKAIQIRKPLVILNTFLSILFFIIQAYFLLRLYSKRSGIGISFLLSDRENSSSSNPLIVIPFIFFGIPIALWLGIVTYALLSSPDLEKPNEEGVTYIHEPVPQPQNAYFDLEKSSASFSQTKAEADLVKEHVEGKKWDESFVKGMLAKNEEAITHFFNACKKKRFDDPTILFQIDNSTPIPRIGVMVSLAKLVALRGIYLWREGRQQEGLESLFMLCDLGSTIQNSQVSMIQYMISVAMTNIGLKGMNQCLHHGSPRLEVLRSGITYLDQLDIGIKGMKSAYTVEYQTMCNLAFKPLSLKNYEPQNWYERIIIRFPLVRDFLYKPNATMQLYADFFRARIADLDKPFIALDRNAGKNFQKRLNMKDLNNIIGKILVSVAAPNTQLAEKLFETKALRIATQTNFALHAYKVEKGKIANSIAELNPIYLKEIPLDPFDGKPLRYSKGKGFVYSVGKNLTDVGGSEGEEWLKMDDPTIKVSY